MSICCTVCTCKMTNHKTQTYLNKTKNFNVLFVLELDSNHTSL